MDGARFDALARTLSRESVRSRRGVLRTAAGGVLVGLWGAVRASAPAQAQVPPALCPAWVLARYPWLCEANEPNTPNNPNNRKNDDDKKDNDKDEKKDTDKDPAPVPGPEPDRCEGVTCPLCETCDTATGQCVPVTCTPPNICCPAGTAGEGTCLLQNSRDCAAPEECCSGRCATAGAPLSRCLPA
jgi:hypothetical protein